MDVLGEELTGATMFPSFYCCSKQVPPPSRDTNMVYLLDVLRGRSADGGSGPCMVAVSVVDVTARKNSQSIYFFLSDLFYQDGYYY